MTVRDELTDQGKLLFGAGFVFGVTVTLCLLAVVLVAVTSGAGATDVGTSLLATVGGGVLFAAIVGAGLTYLAFDHNRAKIPVDPEQFGIDEE